MKKSLTLSIIFLSVFLLGCKKQDPDVKPAESNVIPQREVDLNAGTCNSAQWTTANYAGTTTIRNNFSIRYFSNSSCGATPLIIAIHGGGFVGGNKETMFPSVINTFTNLTEFPPLITEAQLSNHRIAYASINYRFVSANGTHLEAPLNDCKKFITYIRQHAAEYNIDPNRIILMGSSAGASAALWNGLQDPNIKGIIALAPQASLNVVQWQPAIFQPYGMNMLTPIYDQFFTGNPSYVQGYYGTASPNQIQQYSNQHQLHLLNLIDSSDPELFLLTNADDLLHNPCHVYALQQRAQQVGLPSRIAYVRNPYFLHPNVETILQFCLRKF